MLAEIVSLNGMLPDDQLNFISEHLPKEFSSNEPYFDILDKADSFQDITGFLSPFLSDLRKSRKKKAQKEEAHRIIEEDKNNGIKAEIRQLIADYRNPATKYGGSLNSQIDRLRSQWAYFDNAIHKNPTGKTADILDYEAKKFTIPNIRKRWEPVLVQDEELCREVRAAAWDAKARLERKRALRIASPIIDVLIFIISKCVMG